MASTFSPLWAYPSAQSYAHSLTSRGPLCAEVHHSSHRCSRPWAHSGRSSPRCPSRTFSPFLLSATVSPSSVTHRSATLCSSAVSGARAGRRAVQRGGREKGEVYPGMYRVYIYPGVYIAHHTQGVHIPPCSFSRYEARTGLILQL